MISARFEDERRGLRDIFRAAEPRDERECPTRFLERAARNGSLVSSRGRREGMARPSLFPWARVG